MHKQGYFSNTTILFSVLIGALWMLKVNNFIAVQITVPHFYFCNPLGILHHSLKVYWPLAYNTTAVWIQNNPLTCIIIDRTAFKFTSLIVTRSSYLTELLVWLSSFITELLSHLSLKHAVSLFQWVFILLHFWNSHTYSPPATHFYSH